MKKELLMLLAGLTFGVSTAMAFGSANKNNDASKEKADECSKVAVLELERVYQDSAPVKRMNEEYKQKFASRENSLKEKAQALNKEVEEYKKNAPTMSSEDKTKREKELATKHDDLTKVAMELQKERGEFQAKLYKGFQNDLKRAVSSVAEEQKLTLVLNSMAIAYKNDNQIKDVTKDVMDKLK